MLPYADLPQEGFLLRIGQRLPGGLDLLPPGLNSGLQCCSSLGIGGLPLGQQPDLLLKSISGFGDIKDIEWVTNYEGEF